MQDDEGRLTRADSELAASLQCWEEQLRAAMGLPPVPSVGEAGADPRATPTEGPAPIEGDGDLRGGTARTEEAQRVISPCRIQLQRGLLVASASHGDIEQWLAPSGDGADWQAPKLQKEVPAVRLGQGTRRVSRKREVCRATCTHRRTRTPTGGPSTPRTLLSDRTGRDHLRRRSASLSSSAGGATSQGCMWIRSSGCDSVVRSSLASRDVRGGSKVHCVGGLELCHDGARGRQGGPPCRRPRDAWKKERAGLMELYQGEAMCRSPASAAGEVLTLWSIDRITAVNAFFC